MHFKKYLILSFLAICVLNSSFAKSKISDTNINTAIKSQISTNPSLKGVSILIQTIHGIVNLSGNVNSDNQAATAIELAQSAAGVTDVDTSNLTIKDNQPPLTDSVITAKIKGMFQQKKILDKSAISATTINIKTANNIVSLSGNVETKQQIDNAIYIASSIKGVKVVKSTITTSNDHFHKELE